MPKEQNKLQEDNTQLSLFDVTPQKSAKEPSKPQNKWLTVTYQPVSLFSLKRSDATSMAARSNLVPTPCAIKMTLLKVLLEMEGIKHPDNFDSWIQRQFQWIRDLIIYIQPPERIIVNRNGYKLRYWNQQADKDYRKANDKQPPPVMPMQDGYVFREWLYLEGNLRICCGETDKLEELKTLFSQINTFGKRGCFFQYLPEQTEDTPDAQFQPKQQDSCILQPMDDFGNKATFSQINPFSEDKAKLGRDRTIQSATLPLKLESTGAKYDYYRRTDIS